MRKVGTLALLLATAVVLWAQQGSERKKGREKGRVFVDVERLARLHPAWQLAQKLEKLHRPDEKGQGVQGPSTADQTLLLTPVPLTSPFPPLTEFADWARAQMQRWRSEAEGLQRRQQQTAMWQLQIALPPFPLLDPVARWRFMIEQREKQAAERIRLNLRLAFKELLLPQERMALEQRLRELDAALEPPPIVLPPLLLPALPPSELEALTPEPLTDAPQIWALVAPPPSSPSFHQWETEQEARDRLRATVLGERCALKRIAREMARAFAGAYGRRKGWQVVFIPQPSLPDATSEVLVAWRVWLNHILPKE